MRLAARTYTAFMLNAALDTGKYADLGVDEIRASINDGTVFVLLEQRLGEKLSPSWLSAEERAELADEWMRYSEAIDARGKLGIERNGLCLLIAYVLEGLQQDAQHAEGQDAPWNRMN